MKSVFVGLNNDIYCELYLPAVHHSRDVAPYMLLPISRTFPLTHGGHLLYYHPQEVNDTPPSKLAHYRQLPCPSSN